MTEAQRERKREYVRSLTPEQRARYGIVGWVGKDDPRKRKGTWHFGCLYPKGVSMGTVVVQSGLTEAGAWQAFYKVTWPDIKAAVERQGEVFG